MTVSTAIGMMLFMPGQGGPPKVSMRITDYYWKVPIDQERRFKEERDDWVISVVLSREAEDYSPRYGWSKEKPGWGRSPVLRSKTSIKRIDLVYKGQHVIVRSGLKDLYNMNWVRFDLVSTGFDMTMDIGAYDDESQSYDVYSSYRKESIRRVVKEMTEEVVAETRTFRPIKWPSIL